MSMYERIDAFRAQHNDVFYAIFRVMIGVLFAFHGAQKLFGWPGEGVGNPLTSLMGVVGIIELAGGLLIALGLLTSALATISGIVMIAAFFTAHFTLENPLPIANRGELALVYLAAFLYIVFEGGGKHSLDAKLRKRA
jgi:putative oxidoreductase